MVAIEFETELKNGCIHIPTQYASINDIGHVRLVLMYEEKELQAGERKSEAVDAVFDRYHLDLSHFRFDRDEANAR